MSTRQHWQRFEKALRGQSGTPAVSAWQHYPGLEYDTRALAQAIADESRSFGWDWVKINPRGVYYAEIWGAVYDASDYGGGELPRLVSPAFTSVADLASIRPRPDSAVIAEQVELQRRLRDLLPDRPLLFTVFSPLSVLLQGYGLPIYAGATPHGTEAGISLDQLWGASPDELHRALEAITVTLEYLTRSLLDAGADGIFYAVTGTAHPGISRSEENFAVFSVGYDQRVLTAAAGGANVLHTCGPKADPRRFAEWPVQAVHWDVFSDENPGLGEVPGAVGGGTDHRLFTGSHDQELGRQIEAAVTALDGRSFLLSPACTLPSAVISDESRKLLGAVQDS